MPPMPDKADFLQSIKQYRNQAWAILRQLIARTLTEQEMP
jgi:hypothetical protein